MAKKETFTTYTIADIDTFVAKTREELRGLRFSVSGSKTRNVKQALTLRKSVARALTARTAKVGKAQ